MSNTPHAAGGASFSQFKTPESSSGQVVSAVKQFEKSKSSFEPSIQAHQPQPESSSSSLHKYQFTSKSTQQDYNTKHPSLDLDRISNASKESYSPSNHRINSATTNSVQVINSEATNKSHLHSYKKPSDPSSNIISSVFESRKDSKENSGVLKAFRMPKDKKDKGGGETFECK